MPSEAGPGRTRTSNQPVMDSMSRWVFVKPREISVSVGLRGGGKSPLPTSLDSQFPHSAEFAPDRDLMALAIIVENLLWPRINHERQWNAALGQQIGQLLHIVQSASNSALDSQRRQRPIDPRQRP